MFIRMDTENVADLLEKILLLDLKHRQAILEGKVLNKDID